MRRGVEVGDQVWASGEGVLSDHYPMGPGGVVFPTGCFSFPELGLSQGWIVFFAKEDILIFGSQSNQRRMGPQLSVELEDSQSGFLKTPKRVF